MIAAALRAGLEAARATFAALRAAGSPHLPAPPELVTVEAELARPLSHAERRLGIPAPLPPGARAERVRAALAGPPGYYGLGCGGEDPAAPLPWGRYRPRRGEDPARVRVRTAAGKVWLDCSGWLSWVIGVPRRIPGYARGWGYVSTDGLIADAEDPAVELVEFEPIGGTAVPYQHLVVYGWHDDDHDGVRESGEIGHCGVVADVPAGWRYTGPESLEQLQVVHAAASRSPTGAIRMSDGRPWRRRGRLLRVLG